MSRRAEFGIGSTFIEKDADGNETQRRATEAVGSTDPWYGVAGTVEGPDYDYEKQWSQRDD